MHRSQFMLLMFVAGAIVAASMGIRQSFGLFLQPLVTGLDITREVFGLAIAIQNLIWGLAQPVAGLLADKYGSFRVLIICSLLYISGLVLTVYTTSSGGLYLSLGALIGLGMSGTTFTVVLGAVGRMVPAEKRSLAFAIVSAGGSIGMFSFVPASQLFIGLYGWAMALLILAACALLVPLFSLYFKGVPGEVTAGPDEKEVSLSASLRLAGTHSGYWLLNMGFLVCGFHVTFIATHLPAFLKDQSMTPTIAMVALALIGFFNIIGTYAFGACGRYYRKKYLLSSLYLGRAIVIALFLAFPLSQVSVLLFAAAMGLLWLGTVPLTSALIAEIFGARYIGTLFGIVFFSHQLGSFIGAWLGGYVFDVTGSYTPIWQIAILLGVISAALHWPIKDAPVGLQTSPA